MTDFQLRRIQEICWTAGIIDGEGCIQVTKSEKRNIYGLRLSVGMTHEPTIQRLYNLFGTGGVFHAKKASKENWKNKHDWCTTALSEVLFVIGSVYPYLVTKREHADLAMKFGPIWMKGCKSNGHRSSPRTQEELELLEALHQESRRLNARGV